MVAVSGNHTMSWTLVVEVAVSSVDTTACGSGVAAVDVAAIDARNGNTTSDAVSVVHARVVAMVWWWVCCLVD